MEVYLKKTLKHQILQLFYLKKTLKHQILNRKLLILRLNFIKSFCFKPKLNYLKTIHSKAIKFHLLKKLPDF